MTQEDYCSFEVAKLLKEKGFDGLCYCHEFTDYEGNFTTYHTEYPENWNQSEPCVSIPTLGMAMKWLREVHRYYIQIMLDSWALGDHSGYYVVIQKTDSDFEMMLQDAVDDVFYKTYEEACEAALKYSLENLI